MAKVTALMYTFLNLNHQSGKSNQSYRHYWNSLYINNIPHHIIHLDISPPMWKGTTLQTPEWKRCSSHLRVLWMQKQQTQTNSCSFMWPGNLTAGSSIWGLKHHPPQINSLHRNTERERGRAKGRWGGEELHVNGPDHHYKKEQGQ